MKIKHYSTFSEEIDTLLDPLAWEKLRNSATDLSYFLPFTKRDYLKRVEVSEPSSLAAGIILNAKMLAIKKVFSIGSGIAALEYQIKTFSDLKVTVSDYNNSIFRLETFKIFDEVIQFDALQDPLPVGSDTIVIFPRIDTEFEDEQLKILFQKCHFSKVPLICFIPAQLLSFRIVASEVKILIKSLFAFKKRTFCGYSRSLNHFIKLFSPYYVVEDRGPTNSIFYLKHVDDGFGEWNK